MLCTIACSFIGVEMKISITDLDDKEFERLRDMVASGKAHIVSVGGNYSEDSGWHGQIVVKELPVKKAKRNKDHLIFKSMGKWATTK